MYDAEKKVDCFGTGLIALDYILQDGQDPKVCLGGSCANVLSFLRVFGLTVSCSARLGLDEAAEFIRTELAHRNIDLAFPFYEDLGTPIIIQHLRFVDETWSHEFSFESPETGEKLPRIRALNEAQSQAIIEKVGYPGVFYSDRVSSGILKLAQAMRDRGALVYLEPSNKISDEAYLRCCRVSHVLKVSDEVLSVKPHHSVEQRERLIEIITHGKNGVSVLSSLSWAGAKSLPAPKVDAVDAAGAGDWFSASLIASLWRKGWQDVLLSPNKLLSAIGTAQRIAASSCCYVGAQVFLEDKNALRKMAIKEGLYYEGNLVSQVVHCLPSSAPPSHLSRSLDITG
ncbi:PfkB family carbohydrate kinase [Sedimenticola selenatireducens]|uniref:Carbohydrate kinase PfkB domain-containing protein n=1 Tax=Sedimenticola selenatireducens TaxID=191960 RepID=A0A2N6CSH6_9GAMM|nr:PfkB family carbohydrate kinase [Sedimenticola selenatireducens]PLX60036.1 MAG: hypothetical protein C0630_17450 [Sedimenticola selenatireducens]